MFDIAFWVQIKPDITKRIVFDVELLSHINIEGT